MSNGGTSYSSYSQTSNTISNLTNGAYYVIVFYYPVTNQAVSNGQGQSDTYNSTITSGATVVASRAIQDCNYATSMKGLGIKLYLVKTTATSITFNTPNAYATWRNWGLIKITRS